MKYRIIKTTIGDHVKYYLQVHIIKTWFGLFIVKSYWETIASDDTLEDSMARYTIRTKTSHEIVFESNKEDGE